MAHLAASSKSAKPEGDKLATRQRIVEATLALIVRNGGCRGVNLRQIGSRARCAHTNAYNYFASLEELFWAALLWALELQFADTEMALAAPESAEAPLRTLLEGQVVYAEENPALYRLFWLEPLSGQPPPEVLQRLDAMRSLWVRCLGAHLASLGARVDPAWAAQIVHGYFHGEVCKLVGRSAFVPSSPDNRQRIVANTLTLAALLAPGRP